MEEGGIIAKRGRAENMMRLKSKRYVDLSTQKERKRPKRVTKIKIKKGKGEEDEEEEFGCFLVLVIKINKAFKS